MYSGAYNLIVIIQKQRLLTCTITTPQYPVKISYYLLYENAGVRFTESQKQNNSMVILAPDSCLLYSHASLCPLRVWLSEVILFYRLSITL